MLVFNTKIIRYYIKFQRKTRKVQSDGDLAWKLSLFRTLAITTCACVLHVNIQFTLCKLSPLQIFCSLHANFSPCTSVKAASHWGKSSQHVGFFAFHCHNETKEHIILACFQLAHLLNNSKVQTLHRQRHMHHGSPYSRGFARQSHNFA